MVENEALHEAAQPGEAGAPDVDPTTLDHVDEPPSESAMADAAEAADEVETEEAVPEDASYARLVLKRAGIETEEHFPFSTPAVVGRFDPAVGPIDVDLGAIDEGKYVSRKHAEISCSSGVWKIRDLGSSNGTYVLRGDFERVEESEIADGDEVAFGNARFVFRVDESEREVTEVDGEDVA